MATHLDIALKELRISKEEEELSRSSANNL